MIALPLLVLLILSATQDIFNLVITIVSALALHEFYAMVLPADRRFERILATIAGATLTAVLCWQSPLMVLSYLCGCFIFFSIVYLFRFRDLTTVFAQLGVTFIGFLYLPLLLSYMAKLRALESGVEWVFLVLALVMIGDSAAYFVGSSIGKTKLYPAISPNKTIEGSIGGLVGSALIALFFTGLFLPELGYGSAIVVALIVGTFSQVGDLFESMLKRSYGVKDSGTMIPGHGGILDRLDSLLFAFPSAFCLIRIFGL